MKNKDFEKFLDELIEKFYPLKAGVNYKQMKAIEDKINCLSICIEYILLDNESLRRELKAKKN